ncbi:unnamed protein product [Calypogeia fissa]
MGPGVINEPAAMMAVSAACVWRKQGEARQGKAWADGRRSGVTLSKLRGGAFGAAMVVETSYEKAGGGERGGRSCGAFVHIRGRSSGSGGRSVVWWIGCVKRVGGTSPRRHGGSGGWKQLLLWAW